MRNRNRNGLPIGLPNGVSYRGPNGDDFFHEADSEYKGINKPPTEEELAKLGKKNTALNDENVELLSEALFRKELSQKKDEVIVTPEILATIED